MRRSRGQMYIGHGRLRICLSVNRYDNIAPNAKYQPVCPRRGRRATAVLRWKTQIKGTPAGQRKRRGCIKPQIYQGASTVSQAGHSGVCIRSCQLARDNEITEKPL